MEEKQNLDMQEITSEKKENAFKGMLKKVSDVSQKTAHSVQVGIKNMSDKAKSDKYAKRLKKFNPLFPDVYYSEAFNTPNIVAIVDDAERKGIDVCEGAIGWLDSTSGAEVLYLYDEEVEKCGLQFLPTAACDAMYYVDSFDRKKFIRTDCVFGRAHEEKLAELKHIAHSLGAKKCTIEISESQKEVLATKKMFSSSQKAGGYKVSEHKEGYSSNEKSEQRFGRIIAEFEGNTAPKQPELKWFAKDENIKRLVEMRCGGQNTIKTEVLELSCSSSATMTQKAAIAIDGALKVFNAKSKCEMEKQANQESSSKLIFSLEF